MLGVDFLHNYEVQWNFAKAEITIEHKVFKLGSRRGRSDKWCRRVVVAEESTVPVHHLAVVVRFVRVDVCCLALQLLCFSSAIPHSDF